MALEPITAVFGTTVPTEAGYYLCKVKSMQRPKLVYVGSQQMTSSDAGRGYTRGLTVNIGPNDEPIPLGWTNLLWSARVDII